MLNYLRDSFYLLYLVFFQPGLFCGPEKKEKLESDRRGALKLFFRIFPAFAIIFTIIFAAAGFFIENWIYIFLEGIAWGIVLGFIFGFLRGVSAGISVGISAGIAWGIAWVISAWIAFFISGFAVELASGIASGTAWGIAWGITAAIAVAITVGVESGVTVGIAASIVAGVAVGIASGIPAGASACIAFIFSYFRLPFYMFYLPINFFSYYRAGKNQEKAYQIFKKTPLFLDELIFLPLFLTNSFLVIIGKKDREKFLSEIKFISARRPLQNRFAKNALLELTFRDLMKCESIKDISESSKNLEWLPDDPRAFPEGFETALRMINEISNDASRYVASTSNYNKLKIINPLRDDIENLGKYAVSTRGIAGIKSAELSEKWLKIILAESQKFDEKEKEYREIPNPFIFGTPVEEKYKNIFVGRIDVAKTIEENFSHASRVPTFLIRGERRMGKTSVLKHLQRLLGSRYIAVFIDMQSPRARESINTFLYSLSKVIYEKLNKQGIPVERKALDDFRENPYTVFSEWMDSVEEEVEKQDKFVLLCLDEYESIEKSIDSGAFTTDILDEIRSIIQHRKRFVIIFAGIHNFGEMKYDWTNYLISAKNIKLSYLGKNDAVKLITNPIEDFDLNYEKDAVEKILVATNKHPFLVQAVCSELVNHLNEHKRKKAGIDDVEVAVKRVLAAGENYFQNIWNSFNPGEKKILLSVASGNRKIKGKSKKAVKKLIEREILKKVGGEYHFRVDMLGQWIYNREIA